MGKPTTALFIDKYHPNKEGLCAITLRVIYERKKRYYATGIALKEEEYKNAMYPTKKVRVERDGKKIDELVPRKRTDEEKKLFNKLHAFEGKAIKVIDSLPVFTLDLFEKMYRENRDAAGTVSHAFDEYITTLKEEERIGTASSYECAKKSLDNFRKGLRFADITPELLRKYERWMYEQGNSSTTVGIYLRSLRAIFNQQDIDKALYPFSGKSKFKIPASRNIKKALKLEDIGKIYNAQLEPGSKSEMCRDYWMFLYLCNGINVKDMCLLKYKNLDGDFIMFERAKSIRTKKVVEEIRISLKIDAKAIMKRWGQKSINPDTYIFPHLSSGITAVREREIIQLLTSLINDHMEIIRTDLEIPMKVTTYTARHSFATVLKRSGASTEFISEALGHSELKTTKNYLASFEDETLEKATEALTAFK